ncbi:MAG TPA: DUF885 family protein [Proteobacteria bacterium]|nr:hypothetical protein BMS3Abin14_01134 [bacterium BMS3Abin14]HDL52881.1 DUF885 family protein [Pseudomonadota bacterium]
MDGLFTMPSRTSQKYDSIAASVMTLADEMYGLLARTFPVCCYSDEFYFFPQVVVDEIDWRLWDDFSPDRVEDVSRKLARWVLELDALGSGDACPGDLIDISLLIHLAVTLREQLEEVRFHRTQPTFHLAIVTAGLLQAMESGEPSALEMRFWGLDKFLETSGNILVDVPALFRELGVEMVRDTLDWVASLGDQNGVRDSALQAIENFGKRLGGLQVRESFLLPRDLVERIASHHMAVGLSVDEILAEMTEERESLLVELSTLGEELKPGASLMDAYNGIPQVPIPREGKSKLLFQEIERLRGHCLELGLLPRDLAEGCPVKIRAVPQSMTPVRAADSYSALPGHPPAGGTFFVYGEGSLGKASGCIHPVFRMTAAHETYPGHHFLDISRWNLSDVVRRPIERPVFYEGWACFAEELMEQSGFFGQRWDRFILSFRRLRHTIRGIADLDLHMGRMDIEGVAGILTEAGFSAPRAMATARKYSLRPAYQMCYTVGLNRFRSLLGGRNRTETVCMAGRILRQGEIGFDELGRTLR